ncbi:hypothetical protein LTR65_010463 [Meristemomyces frigidus]
MRALGPVLRQGGNWKPSIVGMLRRAGDALHQVHEAETETETAGKVAPDLRKVIHELQTQPSKSDIAELLLTAAAL